ncbi:hypothetical protein CR513_62023, partial [Mucuna pruriens]
MNTLARKQHKTSFHHTTLHKRPNILDLMHYKVYGLMTIIITHEDTSFMLVLTKKLVEIFGGESLMIGVDLINLSLLASLNGDVLDKLLINNTYPTTI